MKTLLILLTSALLGACSVTQVSVQYARYGNGTDDRAVTKQCVRYSLPDIGPPPSAPLDEFSTLPKGDFEGRVHVLLDYVKQLRHHITDAKKQHNSSYQKYLLDCAPE